MSYVLNKFEQVLGAGAIEISKQVWGWGVWGSKMNKLDHVIGDHHMVGREHPK